MSPYTGMQNTAHIALSFTYEYSAAENLKMKSVGT